MAEKVHITIRKRPHEDAVITQRKFFKKTARGKVIKVLRERYLRDDVACGIHSCRECASTSSTAPTLPSSGSMEHKLFPNGHFVLPDTNVFLSQMDLIESTSFTPPIILLQTVMEEVRHRSLPLYNRLKLLIKADDKQTWIFYNEFRSETAVVREEGESPNDRNDRGIRKATSWYNTHISLARPPIRGQPQQVLPTVVLLTDDVANRQKAEKEGIRCMSVRHYVEGTTDPSKLLDLLSAAGQDEIEPTKAVAARHALYPEKYLPMAELLAGVKSGQLHQGHFNANQYNYLEGNVPVSAFDKPVLLIGRENMNRAVQGDVVAVEVFPESEWKAPADEVIDQEATLKNDDAEEAEEEEGAEEVVAERKALQEETQKRQAAERQPTGRIVGIIKRNWRS
ncbi:hypothetical protein NM688_g7830 [Phlebia brevispora]|uniref:Uncharacterized protein n=1 Tax=Phlebia brevispora TaxID=194682 RepID=A0ACC1S175_9APHY|nr:hypothetical protein NM688_g7830 [Phlebia brevispora]